MSSKPIFPKSEAGGSCQTAQSQALSALQLRGLGLYTPADVSVLSAKAYAAGLRMICANKSHMVSTLLFVHLAKLTQPATLLYTLPLTAWLVKSQGVAGWAAATAMVLVLEAILLGLRMDLVIRAMLAIVSCSLQLAQKHCHTKCACLAVSLVFEVFVCIPFTLPKQDLYLRLAFRLGYLPLMQADGDSAKVGHQDDAARIEVQAVVASKPASPDTVPSEQRLEQECKDVPRPSLLPSSPLASLADSPPPKPLDSLCSLNVRNGPISPPASLPPYLSFDHMEQPEPPFLFHSKQQELAGDEEQHMDGEQDEAFGPSEGNQMQNAAGLACEQGKPWEAVGPCDESQAHNAVSLACEQGKPLTEERRGDEREAEQEGEQEQALGSADENQMQNAVSLACEQGKLRAEERKEDQREAKQDGGEEEALGPSAETHVQNAISLACRHLIQAGVDDSTASTLVYKLEPTLLLAVAPKGPAEVMKAIMSITSDEAMQTSIRDAAVSMCRHRLEFLAVPRKVVREIDIGPCLAAIQTSQVSFLRALAVEFADVGVRDLSIWKAAERLAISELARFGLEKSTASNLMGQRKRHFSGRWDLRALLAALHRGPVAILKYISSQVSDEAVQAKAHVLVAARRICQLQLTSVGLSGEDAMSITEKLDAQAMLLAPREEPIETLQALVAQEQNGGLQKRLLQASAQLLRQKLEEMGVQTKIAYILLNGLELRSSLHALRVEPKKLLLALATHMTDRRRAEAVGHAARSVLEHQLVVLGVAQPEAASIAQVFAPTPALAATQMDPFGLLLAALYEVTDKFLHGVLRQAAIALIKSKLSEAGVQASISSLLADEPEGVLLSLMAALRKVIVSASTEYSSYITETSETVFPQQPMSSVGIDDRKAGNTAKGLEAKQSFMSAIQNGPAAVLRAILARLQDEDRQRNQLQDAIDSACERLKRTGVQASDADTILKGVDLDVLLVAACKAPTEVLKVLASQTVTGSSEQWITKACQSVCQHSLSLLGMPPRVAVLVSKRIDAKPVLAAIHVGPPFCLGTLFSQTEDEAVQQILEQAAADLACDRLVRIGVEASIATDIVRLVQQRDPVHFLATVPEGPAALMTLILSQATHQNELSDKIKSAASVVCQQQLTYIGIPSESAIVIARELGARRCLFAIQQGPAAILKVAQVQLTSYTLRHVQHHLLQVAIDLACEELVAIGVQASAARPLLNNMELKPLTAAMLKGSIEILRVLTSKAITATSQEVIGVACRSVCQAIGVETSAPSGLLTQIELRPLTAAMRKGPAELFKELFSQKMSESPQGTIGRACRSVFPLQVAIRTACRSVCSRNLASFGVPDRIATLVSEQIGEKLIVANIHLGPFALLQAALATTQDNDMRQSLSRAAIDLVHEQLVRIGIEASMAADFVQALDNSLDPTLLLAAVPRGPAALMTVILSQVTRKDGLSNIQNVVSVVCQQQLVTSGMSDHTAKLILEQTKNVSEESLLTAAHLGPVALLPRLVARTEDKNVQQILKHAAIDLVHEELMRIGVQAPKATDIVQELDPMHLLAAVPKGPAALMASILTQATHENVLSDIQEVASLVCQQQLDFIGLPSECATILAEEVDVRLCLSAIQKGPAAVLQVAQAQLNLNTLQGGLLQFATDLACEELAAIGVEAAAACALLTRMELRPLTAAMRKGPMEMLRASTFHTMNTSSQEAIRTACRSVCERSLVTSGMSDHTAKLILEQTKNVSEESLLTAAHLGPVALLPRLVAHTEDKNVQQILKQAAIDLVHEELMRIGVQAPKATDIVQELDPMHLLAAVPKGPAALMALILMQATHENVLSDIQAVASLICQQQLTFIGIPSESATIMSKELDAQLCLSAIQQGPAAVLQLAQVQLKGTTLQNLQSQFLQVAIDLACEELVTLGVESSVACAVMKNMQLRPLLAAMRKGSCAVLKELTSQMKQGSCFEITRACRSVCQSRLIALGIPENIAMHISQQLDAESVVTAIHIDPAQFPQAVFGMTSDEKLQRSLIHAVADLLSERLLHVGVKASISVKLVTRFLEKEPKDLLGALNKGPADFLRLIASRVCIEEVRADISEAFKSACLHHLSSMGVPERAAFSISHLIPSEDVLSVLDLGPVAMMQQLASHVQNVELRQSSMVAASAIARKQMIDVGVGASLAHALVQELGEGTLMAMSKGPFVLLQEAFDQTSSKDHRLIDAIWDVMMKAMLDWGVDENITRTLLIALGNERVKELLSALPLGFTGVANFFSQQIERASHSECQVLKKAALQLLVHKVSKLEVSPYAQACLLEMFDTLGAEILFRAVLSEPIAFISSLVRPQQSSTGRQFRRRSMDRTLDLDQNQYAKVSLDIKPMVAVLAKLMIHWLRETLWSEAHRLRLDDVVFQEWQNRKVVDEKEAADLLADNILPMVSLLIEFPCLSPQTAFDMLQAIKDVKSVSALFELQLLGCVYLTGKLMDASNCFKQFGEGNVNGEEFCKQEKEYSIDLFDLVCFISEPPWPRMSFLDDLAPLWQWFLNKSSQFNADAIGVVATLVSRVVAVRFRWNPDGVQELLELLIGDLWRSAQLLRWLQDPLASLKQAARACTTETLVDAFLLLVGRQLGDRSECFKAQTRPLLMLAIEAQSVKDAVASFHIKIDMPPSIYGRPNDVSPSSALDDGVEADVPPIDLQSLLEKALTDPADAISNIRHLSSSLGPSLAMCTEGAGSALDGVEARLDNMQKQLEVIDGIANEMSKHASDVKDEIERHADLLQNPKELGQIMWTQIAAGAGFVFTGAVWFFLRKRCLPVMDVVLDLLQLRDQLEDAEKAVVSYAWPAAQGFFICLPWAFFWATLLREKLLLSRFVRLLLELSYAEEGQVDDDEMKSRREEYMRNPKKQVTYAWWFWAGGHVLQSPSDVVPIRYEDFTCKDYLLEIVVAFPMTIIGVLLLFLMILTFPFFEIGGKSPSNFDLLCDSLVFITQIPLKLISLCAAALLRGLVALKILDASQKSNISSFRRFLCILLANIMLLFVVPVLGVFFLFLLVPLYVLSLPCLLLLPTSDYLDHMHKNFAVSLTCIMYPLTFLLSLCTALLRWMVLAVKNNKKNSFTHIHHGCMHFFSKRLLFLAVFLITLAPGVVLLQICDMLLLLLEPGGHPTHPKVLQLEGLKLLLESSMEAFPLAFLQAVFIISHQGFSDITPTMVASFLTSCSSLAQHVAEIQRLSQQYGCKMSGILVEMLSLDTSTYAPLRLQLRGHDHISYALLRKQLGEDQFSQIGEALQHNKKLRRLDFDRHHNSVSTYALSKILGGLQKNDSVESLRIYDCCGQIDLGMCLCKCRDTGNLITPSGGVICQVCGHAKEICKCDSSPLPQLKAGRTCSHCKNPRPTEFLKLSEVSWGILGSNRILQEMYLEGILLEKDSMNLLETLATQLSQNGVRRLHLAWAQTSQEPQSESTSESKSQKSGTFFTHFHELSFRHGPPLLAYVISRSVELTTCKLQTLAVSYMKLPEEFEPDKLLSSRSLRHLSLLGLEKDDFSKIIALIGNYRGSQRCNLHALVVTMKGCSGSFDDENEMAITGCRTFFRSAQELQVFAIGRCPMERKSQAYTSSFFTLKAVHTGCLKLASWLGEALTESSGGALDCSVTSFDPQLALQQAVEAAPASSMGKKQLRKQAMQTLATAALDSRAMHTIAIRHATKDAVLPLLAYLVAHASAELRELIAHDCTFGGRASRALASLAAKSRKLQLLDISGGSTFRPGGLSRLGHGLYYRTRNLLGDIRLEVDLSDTFVPPPVLSSLLCPVVDRRLSKRPAAIIRFDRLKLVPWYWEKLPCKSSNSNLEENVRLLREGKSLDRPKMEALSKSDQCLCAYLMGSLARELARGESKEALPDKFDLFEGSSHAWFIRGVLQDVDTLHFGNRVNLDQALITCILTRACQNDTYGAAIADAMPVSQLLKTVNLECNHLGPKAVEAIAEAMPKCSNLQTISFQQTQLGSEAGQKIAAAMPNCRSLQVINLGSNALGPQAGNAIAEAMPKCSNLQTIILEETLLDPVAGEKIAAAMPKCHRLQEINVGSNALGLEAGKAIAEAMPKCSDLQTIILKETQLGSEAGEAIADAMLQCEKLRSVNLENNHLGERAGRIIAAAMPKCQSLNEINLGGNALGSEAGKAIAKAMPKCSNLQTIILKETDLGSEAGEAIADAMLQCRELRTINLEGNHFGPQAGKKIVSAMPECQNLNEINLRRNALGLEAGEAIAEAMRKCSNLQTINLEHTRLGREAGEKIAAAMPKCQSLKEINFASNDLGEAGKNVAEAMPKCSNLQTIILKETRLGSEACEAIADTLLHCRKLRIINLEGNHLGPNVCKTIAAAMPGCHSLNEINLGDNHLGLEAAKAFADAMRMCSKLEKINLKHTRLGTEAGEKIAAAMSECQSLKEINLGGNALGPEAGKAIAEAMPKCSNLQAIILNENQLGSEAGEAIADAMLQCWELRTINLEGCHLGPKASEKIAAAMPKCQSLNEINLGGNAVGSEAGKAIAEAMPKCSNLQTIILKETQLGSEAGEAIADAMLHCRQLRIINLEVNHLGPRAGKNIAAAMLARQSLNEIHLGGNAFGLRACKAIVEAMRKYSKLQVINLRGTALGPEAAKAIAEAMTKCSDLQTIILEQTQLDSEAVKKIATAMPTCHRLREINVGSNAIGLEAGEAVADAMPKCPNLQAINLNHTQLGSEAGQKIAAAIPNCRSLQVINLGRNALGPQAGKAIAEAMPKCSNLQKIILEETLLDQEAGEKIATAMPKCHRLQEINVGSNALGLKAGKAIAEAMPKCSDLQTIILKETQLGSEAGEKIVAAMPQCRNLQVIDLGSNCLGVKTGSLIADIMPDCYGLREINISRNDFGPDFDKAIAAVKPRCPSLLTITL